MYIVSNGLQINKSHGTINNMSTYDDEARAGKHWVFRVQIDYKDYECDD